MSPALKSLAEELETAQQALAIPIEGLVNFTLLDIPPELKAEVQAQLNYLRERSIRQQAVMQALVALSESGYPDIPVRPLPAGQLERLDDEREQLESALSLFTTAEATKAQITLDKIGEPA